MATINATAPVKEPRIHIISRGRQGWAVVNHVGKRALRVFDSRKEATDFAQALAKAQHIDVIIHNKNGRVEKWIKN